MKPIIAVAMSGGVDSSVTAAYLKSQGHDLFGIFMKNWEHDDGFQCSSEQDKNDAASVCEQIDIPFYTINFASEYWQHVFEPALQAYANGLTPNPDLDCNRAIKFNWLWSYAKNLGATHLATGHYAQIDHQKRLFRASDRSKDQTYFLAHVDDWPDVLFPLGSWMKSDVRAHARSIHLLNAEKKDSTGLCFIGERKFSNFLRQFIPDHPGDIVDSETGKRQGTHKGLHYFTLGQRKGLGLGGAGSGWYVLSKDISSNTLYVTQFAHRLYKKHFVCESIVWHPNAYQPKSPLSVQIRHQKNQTIACQIEPIDSKRYKIQTQSDLFAPAPGQWAVFYQEPYVVGRGMICGESSD